MPVDRRSFLAALAASATAPAVIRAQGSHARYPIAFSTLGCPAWSWKAILDNADRLGYRALELRGVAGEMDLTKVPELTGSQQAGTKKDLDALGLVISDLGSSSNMHVEEPAARAKQLDEGRRFIDLAQALGVKYVRMFGNNIPKDELREDVMKRVVDGFRQMVEHAAPAGVTVLIESHGDFTRAKDLVEVLTRVDSSHFALLWDAHHSFVTGGEQPAESYAALGKWIRHTHLKDSRATGPNVGDRRYVLLGTGEVPVEAQVKVLAGAGYAGFYCFEWEKKWHPEIEEPEVAFPHFAKTMAGYLAAAGVKPS